VIAGDLKNGRTLHSLVRGLAHFENNTVYLLSPPELRLREDDRSKFETLPITPVEIDDPGRIPKDANFWYWTRVQKERFDKPEDYETVKDSMILTPELLKKRGNPDLVIMHPGPISDINEIDRRIVEEDPRCIYFEQVAKGLPVRMALLSLTLGKIK
jgi:aspartate carbamoyltransferase catalytic subunit